MFCFVFHIYGFILFIVVYIQINWHSGDAFPCIKREIWCNIGLLPQALRLFIVEYCSQATWTGCCYWAIIEGDILRRERCIHHQCTAWILPAKVDQFPCACTTNGCTTESTVYIKPCPWLQHLGIIVLPPLKALTERLQEGGSPREEKAATPLNVLKQVQEIRTSSFYSWLMMMMVCWELPQLPPWAVAAGGPGSDARCVGGVVPLHSLCDTSSPGGPLVFFFLFFFSFKGHENVRNANTYREW